MAAITAPPITSSIFQFPPNFPNGQVSDAWIAWFQTVEANVPIFPAFQSGYALGWDATGNLVNVPNTGADQYATLADTTLATNGAGRIGYNNALNYPASTVGFELSTLATNFGNYTTTASLISSFVSKAILADTTVPTNGASLVGYLAPYIGAVPTTQQKVNDERISVKRFGAVGDGTTNDTASIQSALDSGVKNIYFPPGTYLCDHLNITINDQRLYGDRYSSVIKLSTVGNVYGELVGVRADGVTIENISLLNTNLGPIGAGSYYNGFGITNSYAKITGCVVSGFISPGAYPSAGPWGAIGGGKGIHIDQGGVDNIITNNIVSGCVWGLSNVGDYTTINTMRNIFDNNVVEGCDIAMVAWAFSDAIAEVSPPNHLTYLMQNSYSNNKIYNCRVGCLLHRVAGCTVRGNSLNNNYSTVSMTHATTGLATTTVNVFQCSGCGDNIFSENVSGGLYSAYVDFTNIYGSVRRSAYNQFSLNNFAGTTTDGVLGNAALTNNQANKYYLNQIRGYSGLRYKNISASYDVRVEADFEATGTSLFDVWGGGVLSLQVFGGQASSPALNLSGIPTSTSYANDAAAAAGGVGVGSVYRNGSVMQIRIA